MKINAILFDYWEEPGWNQSQEVPKEATFALKLQVAL